MPIKNKDPYLTLVTLGKKTALYGSINTILHWDQETYLPQKGHGVRAEELELLAGIIHKEKTSKKFKDALNALIDLQTGVFKDPHLNPKSKAALIHWRRDYLQTSKLPKTFVEEFAKCSSTSTQAWKEAKAKNDFPSFRPHLEKMIHLCRKQAEFLGYEEHPYDALLDLFEPQMTTSTLTNLFEKLKTPLMSLLKQISLKKEPESGFLYQDYDSERQFKFGKKLLSAMGFDPSFTRLDLSAHPMCISAHPQDIRLTTRVYPHLFMSNIFSCIHEGGHGLYHANFPHEHYGTPLCSSASLGIDESQSRLWETIVGRSLPFWQHFFPLLQEEFPQQLGSVTLEDFYKAINLVKPTFIRTESDEVTYNLHILIRFELEKALIEGALKVKDLPEAWNEKMQQYLTIKPSTDVQGCLQDVHWSMGAIGYFPTYTLGNLYAATFFATFAKKHPNWKEKIARGELSFLTQFLKEEIHRWGREYFANELCQKVTGCSLHETPFIHYLQNKYTTLYGLK